MANPEQLHPDMIVGDVLQRWPQTSAVFWHYRAACIGCAFESFCTLAYVVAVHQIELETLLHELAVVIEDDLAA